MRYVKKQVDYDSAYLIPLSDIHIGDYNADLELFADYIKWIKEHKNALVFLNGDIINLATTASASSVFEQEAGLSWQINKAVDLLEPIKDRILGCITGNHEQRLEKFAGFNPTEVLAYNLKIPYCKYSAVIELDIKDQKYIIYTHHTTGGGGQTVGNKMNRVDLLRKLVCNADVYIGSHNHHLGVMPVVTNFYEPNEGKTVQKRQLLVDSGSFLKWNDSYAEMTQLSPAKLGCPRLRFDGIKHDVHCSI